MPRLTGFPAIATAIKSVFVTLALISVTLRSIAKTRRDRRWKWHDFLCYFSSILFLADYINTLVGALDGGLGLHITHVTTTQLRVTSKVYIAHNIIWCTAVALFRLSILALYKELFPKSTFRRVASLLQLLVSLVLTTQIMGECLICRPFRKLWDNNVRGVCGDFSKANLSAAAINLVLDILVVLLPLPIVWRLQMSKQKKVGISVTFGLSLCTAAINIGRIIRLANCDARDQTFCIEQSMMFTYAETSIGITVACLPLLGPVLLPQRFDSSSGQTRQLQHRYQRRWDAPTTARTRLRGTEVDGSFHQLDADDDDHIQLDGAIPTSTDIESSGTVDYLPPPPEPVANATHVFSALRDRR